MSDTTFMVIITIVILVLFALFIISTAWTLVEKKFFFNFLFLLIFASGPAKNNWIIISKAVRNALTRYGGKIEKIYALLLNRSIAS